ncbi:O-antigen ligase domain-containing protein [Bradyrhizobium sp. MOS002]|nr:O-antigen ligase domain-containing protein [Bradyrhizobium sp. MOS002]
MWSRKARQRRFSLSSLAAAVLYTALAGAPFLFGSRDPITVAGWCALLGVGLIVAPTRRLLKGHLLLLAGLGVVLLCFGFVLHEQLSDRPFIAQFNPIWAKASEALGKPLTPSVSIVRGEPFFALGHPLANVLAMVLGLIVGADPDRARRGVRVMAWAGAVYALYGIFALAFDPTEILWREKTAYLGNLTATFINRNTAACYFGSCAAVWLVLLMSAIRRNLPPGKLEWRGVPHHLLRKTHKDVLIRFVMFFVCLSAMFMTSSRGGVLVSLGVMVIAFVIFFGPDMPRGLGFVGAIAGSAATALLLLQVLGGNVSSRIDLQGLSDAGRLSVYRSTLRIIADNPRFGTGLGTFAYAFPAYRSSDISMQGRWDIAHNTYLEFASELGIPLAIVVGVAWIVALLVLARGVRVPRRDMVVPLAALAVSLIGLLHSSIDFSLQIAGYSIVLFALLGLGLGQAVYVRDRERERRGDRAAAPPSKADLQARSGR